MAVKFFDKLSDDYLEFLDDKDDFNVIINAGEPSNTKTFQAHSIVLRHRSLYFRNELAKMSRGKNSIKTINLRNVSVQQFEIIIKYIYGGLILLENLEASFIFELMLVACDLLLGELYKYLEAYLIDTKAIWLRLRFAHVYKTSFENDKLQELQKWCNDIVAKYPSKVFESEGFTTFPEKSLVSLLERDDLQMEEGRVWDHVIRWGIAQITNLPSEPKDWSRENCSALKNTLRNCLPLIRYFQMSNEDIIDKVKPYKKILDKQLWEDILKKFLTPNRPITTTILPPRSPFSAVITKSQAAEIASWIDKKADPYTDINNPYEFRLLLRGTRDGFTTESFWNLCDKQEKLMIVMKVKDTDEIIGGYNPIGWDKSINNWTNCEDTFLFSLKNGTIEESVLSRIKDPQYAVGSYSDCGAQLGRGSDLFTGNNFDQEKKCYCNQTSYEKPIRNTRDWFSVSEYEVFQIYEKA